MKKVILTVLLLMIVQWKINPSLSSASEFNGPYLDSIFSHPCAAPFSVGATFTSQFKANGGATMMGVLWHPADPHNTLMPQKLLDLGIQPIGWALDVGLGGNSGDYFVPMGISVNLLPTVLGPGLKLMKESGNKTLQGISSIIVSDNGGVAFGPKWIAYPLINGTLLPLNSWRFPPGWFVGATYKFKTSI